MTEQHVPVLLAETVEALQVRPGGRYIDCTVGQGGHAAAILEMSSPGGQLLAIDADPEAIEAARVRLHSYSRRVLLVNQNFNSLEDICTRHSFRPVHGIMFDLGMSSLQLSESGRGFSFRYDAPLDMRFNPRQEITAAEIVNDFPESDLARIIEEYGEERRGRRIARHIVTHRPVGTTGQLAEIVARATGRKAGGIHPATRTFQALRIAVNKELECLGQALEQAGQLLGFGGRLAVITFHSLEDRLVKEFIRQHEILHAVNKKVIRPTLEEIRRNPRSRSAKLRVAGRRDDDSKPRERGWATA